VSATALLVVAVVGASTALMAGTVAIVQTDIKRVLAYSTVSQLGFMFLAAGVGAFGVAIFHLYTHAFFKALLFLGAGSVIHALSGEQEMSRMGGLWRRIPWTFGTMLVASLSIAGIPPLAGYWSKDEILLGAFRTGHRVLFAMALVAALLTAAYMARLLFLTFFGRFRGSPEAERHVHESPASMLLPLVVLAVGSAAAGFVSIPHIVQPVFRMPVQELRPLPWLPFVAVLLALVGALLAWYLYLALPELRGSLARALRPLLTLFRAKYYFDHVYDAFVRRVVVAGSEGVLWKRVDAGLIDGAVNGAGSVTAAFAELLSPLQTGLVRHYALVVLGGAVAVVSYLLWS
jgi:NADH-quinone oxidoreductase subunit L